MLVARGVAALEYLRVRLPVFADLLLQLAFDPFEGPALYAAELRGFILYAEKERVLVFDGRPLPAVRLLDADAALLFELQLGDGGAVDLVRAVCQAEDARLGPEGGERGVA